MGCSFFANTPAIDCCDGRGKLHCYAVRDERSDARKAKELFFVYEVCPAGGLDKTLAPIMDGIFRFGPADA